MSLNKLEVLTALLSSYGKETHCVEQGKLPVSRAGEILESTEIRAVGKSLVELLAQIRTQIDLIVYTNTCPSHGCEIHYRPFDVLEIERNGVKENFVSIHISVDTLGYEYEEFIPRRHTHEKMFSVSEIFTALVKIHGIHVKHGSPDKELMSADFVVNWYNLSEFLDECSQFVNGTLSEKQGTIYLIEHKTTNYDHPVKNETCFKIAHELSY